MGRSVINGIVMIAGVALYGVTGGASLYAATAIVTVSNIQAAQQAKRRAAKQGADTGTRLQMGRQSNAPDILIVGRTRIATQTIAYWCTHGENNEYLTAVLPICRHEIDAFEEIYLNDEPVGPLDADGYPVGGKFRPSKIKQTSNAFRFTAVGQTFELAAEPLSTAIDAIAARATYATQADSGAFERPLVRDVDYSISGRTITVLRDPGLGAESQPGFVSRLDAPTVVITYRYDAGEPFVRIKRYLGLPAGERDLDLEAVSINPDTGVQEWTSAHLGKSVARLHITFKWDRNVFTTGMPNVTAIVRGMKVVHPVTGLPTWTENAALITAEYIKRTFHVTSDRISLSHLLAAAGICDEVVPTKGPPGTQNRYRIGGIIRTDRSPRENLDDLYAAMGGAGVFSEGKWRIYAGAYQTPVTLTLGDDDLASTSVAVRPFESRAQLINSVRGQFNDPRPPNNYQTVDFPPYSSPTYVEYDRQEYWADVDLPYTQNHEAAQRLAKLLMYRSRLAMMVTATWKMKAYPLQAGDVVRLRLTQFGFDQVDGGLGKPFRIVRRRVNFMTSSSPPSVELVLQEDTPEIYEWDYNEAGHREPAPKTGLPDPTYVEPLLGMSAYSGPETFDRMSDGTTIVPYVRLTWLPPADIGALEGGEILIYWKRSVDVDWRIVRAQPQPRPEDCVAKLYPIRAGDLLTVHAVVTNGIGVESDEAFVLHVVAADVAAIAYNGGGAPTTANWLTNPTFEDGTAGWTLEQGAGPPADFVRIPQSVPGIPTSARLYQGPLNKFSPYAPFAAASTPIPVTPGSRWAAYGLLCSKLANGFIGVRWLTASGVLLGNEMSSTPVMPTNASPDDAASYAMRSMIVQAPANAAQARFFIYAPGSNAEPAGEVHLLRPFFGPAMEGSNEMPPWDAGIAPRDSVTSANLVVNTTFAYGVEGWSADRSSPLPGTAVIALDPNRIGASPHNARVTYQGSPVTGGWFFAASTVISVEPGTWVAAMADLIPVSCRGRVQIDFYGLSGSFLSSAAPTDSVTPRAMPAVPALPDFLRSGLICRVPASAVRAYLIIVGESMTGTNPFVSFARPFLGKVTPGKYSLPEWNAGANGQVNTGQISPNAVTFSLQAKAAGPVTTGGFSNFSFNLAPLAITTKAPAVAKVRATFDLQSNGPVSKQIFICTTNGATIYAAGRVPVVAPEMVVDGVTGQVRAVSGTSYYGRGVVDATIELPAGTATIAVGHQGPGVVTAQEIVSNIEINAIVTYR